MTSGETAKRSLFSTVFGFSTVNCLWCYRNKIDRSLISLYHYHRLIITLLQLIERLFQLDSHIGKSHISFGKVNRDASELSTKKKVCKTKVDNFNNFTAPVMSYIG
ncbi:hypothetical protein AB6A40_010480 [Gnathostoma spinigerum]|uniref:Uncharacterized protein n=1 Tax=Gnathostoma spinigerum TaxID=75299 RepID=A0ABD6F184_9BILA